jgi:hypothetical protein
VFLGMGEIVLRRRQLKALAFAVLAPVKP